MATDKKDFEQKINADPSGFLAGWQKAAFGAQQGADKIKESANRIGEAFEAVRAPLLAISALFAGGAFFKEMIEGANKLNGEFGETMNIARSLGLAGTEASALRTALDDIGSDSETYIGAFQKFARQLKSNEAGLQAMGLRTRDANGDLRDSNELYTEALHMVGQYKPGLDQTTAAMTLFGKSVNEVLGLQRLNNDVIEEAKKKNEELGLTITNESVAASKKYKMAVQDMGDVFEGLENVIGQAVMPVFTELAEWFSSVGPPLVYGFKLAIDTLATAFHGVTLVVKSVWTVLSALADPLFTFGSALRKLLSGDMTGATNEMMKMGSNWGAAMSGVFSKIKEDSARTWGDVKNLWGHGTELETPGKGTKTMGDFKLTNRGTSGTDSRMGQWEAQLADRKAAIQRQGLLEGQYREMSKAEEQKYWDDLKNMQGLSDQERIALSRRSAEAEMAGIKQNFDVKVATLQAEAAAFKNNTEERMRLELQIQAKYQEGTKEYAASAKNIVAIQQQAAAQERTIRESRVQAERDARLQSIALEEQTIQTAAQLGLATQAQVLDAQQQFELRRNAIALDALQQRLAAAQADPDRNPVEIDKINRQIEALEQQHQLRMGQIQNAQRVEGAKYQIQFFQSMQTSLQTQINGLLTGTQRIGSAFKNMFAAMGQSLAQTVSKMAADWLMGQIQMRVASKETSLAQLQNSAVSAAGGAYNAIVGIPYVGPFLAPVAAAVAYAGVMAFGSMASAAGGFDIPGNVNPIVQTHAREMILPAKHADVIRNLADGGGASGGGAMHLHVHAVDAKSVKELFQQNGAALVDVMRKQRRNFAFAG
jgi:hypothetical protein